MNANTTIIPKNHTTKELLKAQTYIWTQIFNFLNSMALKCAIDLQIPDTIHMHGKPMTLNHLITALSLNPTKGTSLYRVLRVLVHSNFLSKSYLVNGEEAYNLTINSQLLLRNHPMTLAPFALAMLDPTLTDPAHQIGVWFRNKDVSPFHTAHGCGLFEYANSVSKFNDYFNEAMASDAKFVGDILMSDGEFKGLLEGVGSLVDVGGGTGTLARIIAKGCPNVKCSVLDLPHVVEGLHKNGLELDFVGGDMFVAIPPADVVLLKWILHDWSDDHCIKILEKCKEAIPSKDEGGKVMIIDMVMDTQNDDVSSAQHSFDLEMLALTSGGKERTEEEWKQLFIKAGYVDYKIFHILGSRSVIVVYPSVI
ncbi:hypothetical protein RND81_02G081800 [Saponaria officinalis]|uniref:Uncharacterized protein n=1 Tax=Saponaria officinalis TaxID=3572 RepID=A0AAW1MRP6_SAPOF